MAAGERDFELVRLAGEDLSGQNLSGIRAYGSDFSRVNCEGANLAGADLTDVLDELSPRQHAPGQTRIQANHNGAVCAIDARRGYRPLTGRLHRRT